MRVDGQVVRDPERRTDGRRERIEVDGRPLRAKKPVYLVLNKPDGVITASHDPAGRPTAQALLPPQESWIFPVGRLDARTSGVLLFTNDAVLSDSILGGDSHVDKRYEAKVKGVVTDESIDRLRRGVEVEDEKGRRYRTRPAEVEVLKRGGGSTWLAITLREGRYRQVRRMAEAVGHPVVKLRRTRFGPVELGDLAPGATRPLTPGELDILQVLAAEAQRREGNPWPTPRRPSRGR